MPDWDGAGCARGRARMQRFASSGLKTSLLPVAGAAGVESVGLTPVGEVMGCMVQQIGWQGYGWLRLLRIRVFRLLQPECFTSGDGQRFAGYRPYVGALYRGYRLHWRACRSRQSLMGADGIVGLGCRGAERQSVR